MKYRIYVDEVGNSDLKSSDDPNHRYLSLTGVIIELDYAKTVLHPDIENLKIEFFDAHPDEQVVLHRKEILNKRPPFNNLNDPVLEKTFNQKLLELLTKWEYKIVTVVIDKSEHNSKYQKWKYDPYHYCMEILIERFHFFLSATRAIGDVMIESRGGKEDMRLKKSFRRIIENGTHYIDTIGLKSRFSSVELKVKPKSANISGLQLADLVAFPSRKFVLAHFKRISDNRVTFNDSINEILKNKYYRDGDRIEGYGFKFLP